jgi:hypothetical protein
MGNDADHRKLFAAVQLLTAAMVEADAPHNAPTILLSYQVMSLSSPTCTTGRLTHETMPAVTCGAPVGRAVCSVDTARLVTQPCRAGGGSFGD